MKKLQGNWIRLALRNGTKGREQIEALAYDQDWFLDEVVQASDDAPFELVYLVGDGKTSVHYIQDEIIGLDYIFIRGDECEAIAELVRSRVDTIAVKDAIDFARNNTDREFVVNASYILGATGSSTFNQDVFDLLTGFLKHDVADARHGALLAIGYLEWPEFIPHFKPLFDDPDETVRDVAKSAWEHASKHWQ